MLLVKPCKRNGESGWKYGDTGRPYFGSGAKRRAVAQGVALELDRHRHSPYKDAAEQRLVMRACEDAILELSDQDVIAFLTRHQARMVEILLDDPQDKVSIKKTAKDEQKLWAEVYIPGFPDTHGATMTKEEIGKMAHDFLKQGRQRRLNVGHSCKHDVNLPCDCGMGASMIETFQAGEGWEVEKGSGVYWTPGSWVVALDVPSQEVWKKVKSGEIGGLSMEALVLMRDREVELLIPDDGIVRGPTLRLLGEDHDHDWEVRFDDRGRFTGGMTTVTRGAKHHVHRIQGMTTTDWFEATGIPRHGHRFSVPDAVQLA